MVDGSIVGTLVRLVVSLAVVLLLLVFLARYLNNRQLGGGRAVARPVGASRSPTSRCSPVTASAVARPGRRPCRRPAAARRRDRDLGDRPARAGRAAGGADAGLLQDVPQDVVQDNHPRIATGLPQDLAAGRPVPRPPARSSRRCVSGRPVVADLVRRVVPALLLAPLFALLVGGGPVAQAAPASAPVAVAATSRGPSCGALAAPARRPGRARCANPTPAPRPSSAASPAPGTSGAVKSPGSVSVDLDPGGGKPSQTVSIILLLTVLSVAPALLVLCTSFTKIFVVLSLTRNALGTADDPAEPGARRPGAVPQPVHHGAGAVADERPGAAALPQGRQISQSQAFDDRREAAARRSCSSRPARTSCAHDDPAEQGGPPGHAGGRAADHAGPGVRAVRAASRRSSSASSSSSRSWSSTWWSSAVADVDGHDDAAAGD